MPNGPSDKPTNEFRAGTVVAAIWTKTTALNGRNVPQHSIRIQKRYRDEKSGETNGRASVHIAGRLAGSGPTEHAIVVPEE